MIENCNTLTAGQRVFNIVAEGVVAVDKIEDACASPVF